MSQNDDLAPIVAQLCNARQAAEVLKVHVRTIWNLVTAGHITPVRIPGVGTRFWVGDLLELAEKHTQRIQHAADAAAVHAAEAGEQD